MSSHYKIDTENSQNYYQLLLTCTGISVITHIEQMEQKEQIRNVVFSSRDPKFQLTNYFWSIKKGEMTYDDT